MRQGRGLLRFASGGFYEGEFAENIFNGQGARLYASGTYYEGEFLDGEFHGQGKLRFIDGTTQEGTFAKGVLHGNGIVIIPDGNTYQGDLFEGVYHGQGTLWFDDGTIYQGNFEKGQLHGEGILASTEGFSYKGNFVNGMLHGRGSLIDMDGGTYEGEFVSGKRTGEFVYAYEDTISEKMEFVDGYCTNLDRSNIGNPLFFSLLFGIKSGGNPPNYVGTILIDYLTHYFQDAPPAQKAVIEKLANKKTFTETDPLLVNAELIQIIEELKGGRSCLLPYGCQGHAMLLNLVPSKDGLFIDFEVFNSGWGLKDHHAYDPETGKYQLMKKIRIPSEELTVEKLLEIRNCENFLHIDQSYSALLGTKGSKEIQPENPLWKKPQKGDNCGIECYIAFLAEELPPEVNARLRKDLFSDSLQARLAQSPTLANGVNILEIDRVQHKMQKLGIEI